MPKHVNVLRGEQIIWVQGLNAHKIVQRGRYLSSVAWVMVPRPSNGDGIGWMRLGKIFS